jgi:hypothetical protein
MMTQVRQGCWLEASCISRPMGILARERSPGHQVVPDPRPGRRQGVASLVDMQPNRRWNREPTEALFTGNPTNQLVG